MKKTLLALTLALVSALCAGQESGVLLMAEGRDNIMQNWEVPRGKWEGQPKWSPTSNTPPPLSITKAVELGEAWLLKQHSDVKRLALSQVTIRAQSQSGTDTRDGWFYRIEFQPVLAGRKLWGGELVAVVLLDGTVVAPHAEPYNSRR